MVMRKQREKRAWLKLTNTFLGWGVVGQLTALFPFSGKETLNLVDYLDQVILSYCTL
jgi:hypothetical protein